jgi:hypothetical protein
VTHWDAQLAPGGMVGQLRMERVSDSLGCTISPWRDGGSTEDGEGINSQPLEGRRSTGDVGG